MSTSAPLRAALYCRISEKKKVKAGEEVAHDSVAVQKKNLEKLAKDHGYVVQEAYADNGVSAYSGVTRSDWLRLLKDMKLKKFDVILAVAEDRLARSSFEKIGLQRDCINAGVTWHTVASGKVDPSTAEGGLMSTITGAVAQYESSIKKERLRARYDDEISQGNALWGARPFGYTAARDGVVIPEEQELIKAAYETILSSGTLYEIAKRWNVAGVRTSRGNEWTYQTVRQLLLRPRNAGLVVRDGVVQEGIKAKWEPLVTRETLTDATSLLNHSDRVTAPGRKQTYLCSGLVKCGVCDGPMRSHTVKVRGVVIPHYRCAAKLRVSTDKTRHTAIRVDQLDPMVRHEIVSAFLLGPKNMFTAGHRIDTAPLHQEQAKIRASVEAVLQSLSDHPRWAAQYDKQLKALTKQDDELTAQLRAAAEASAHAAMTVDLREGLFTNGRVRLEDAKKARKQLTANFDALTLERKRDLVKTHLEIKINPGRKLQRIEIVHTSVLSLNAPEEVHVELDESKLGITLESEKLRLLELNETTAAALPYDTSVSQLGDLQPR